MNFTSRRFEQRLKASALRLKEQRNKERFYKNEPMHNPCNSEHASCDALQMSCDQGIFDKQESAQHPARALDDATYINNILTQTRSLLSKDKETN